MGAQAVEQGYPTNLAVCFSSENHCVKQILQKLTTTRPLYVNIKPIKHNRSKRPNIPSRSFWSKRLPEEISNIFSLLH